MILGNTIPIKKQTYSGNKENKTNCFRGIRSIKFEGTTCGSFFLVQTCRGHFRGLLQQALGPISFVRKTLVIRAFWFL